MSGLGQSILKFAGHLALLAGLTLQGAGCGYVLQGSHSELLDREGIRTIYVKPLVNNTFKPGVENVVYNALIRTLMTHRRVKLVQSEENADAILQGAVMTAQFGIAASSSAADLPPKKVFEKGSGLELGQTAVASVYSAALGCEFSLNRRVVSPTQKRVLWSSGFSRSKPFLAANQLDVPGATSALINESEFERALSEIATTMMDDVHEFMLAMF